MTTGKQVGAAVRLGRQLLTQPDIETDWILWPRGLAISSKSERLDIDFPSEVNPEEQTSVLVNNRHLAKAGNDVDKNEFTFTVNDQGRAIINGVTLPAVSGFGIEPNPEPEMTRAGEIAAASILALVPFVASSDLRPTLTCVHYGPNGINATDSYRLARISDETSEVTGLFPAAIARSLARAAAAPIKVGFAPDFEQSRRYRLQTETKSGLTVSYWGTAPSGNYPDPELLWEQAPVEPLVEGILTAESRSQFDKIERWAENDGQVAVLVAVDGQITAELPGSGSDQAQVAPAPIASDLRRLGEIETAMVGVRPGYLAQVPEFFAGQEVKVRFSGPDKPALFLSSDRLLLQAPLRIDNWP
jgi:hypothetical protein